MIALTETQFSPQQRTSNLLNDAVLQNASIILKVEQLTIGSDPKSYAFSPNVALCEIVTMEPTLSPTNDPTTKPPTMSPIDIPTNEPTKTPTMAPTYFMEIEWCKVLIVDTRWYSIT